MSGVSAQDYAAIVNHLAHYCHYIDEGEAERWAACFTEDGAFDGPATPKPVVGRQALIEFAQATATASDGGKMRHMVGNIACDYGESPDVVLAKVYNHVTTWDGGRRPMALMAISDMVLARAGDGWLLKRNAYRLLT